MKNEERTTKRVPMLLAEFLVAFGALVTLSILLFSILSYLLGAAL